MNNKADVNRRVLAIQAKKKRHKTNKKRGKANGVAGAHSQHLQQNQQHYEANDENSSPPDISIDNHLEDGGLQSPDFVTDVCDISSKILKPYCVAPSSSGSNSLADNTTATGSSNTLDEVNFINKSAKSSKKSSETKESRIRSHPNDDNDYEEDYRQQSSQNYATESRNNDDSTYYQSQPYKNNAVSYVDNTKKVQDNPKKFLQKCLLQQDQKQLQQYVCPPRSSSNDSEESEVNSENDEQELKEDYCKGGYHPVNIGDLFQGMYLQIKTTFQ